MKSPDYSEVIQRLIRRINGLIPQMPRKDDLFGFLKDLDNVVQQKYRRNIENNEMLRDRIKRAHDEKCRKEEEIQKIHQQYQAEKKFTDEMIIQFCSLIIQEQWQHYSIMKTEKKVYESKVSQIERSLQQIREEYDKKINNIDEQLHQDREQNTSTEAGKRDEWNKEKRQLNSILLQYDSKMMEKQEEIENIQKIIEDEKCKLKFYKNACESHKETYEMLMKEKEEYQEQQRQRKLYEIRVRMAQRTIVKFVEQYYPPWKRRRMKMKAAKKKNKYKFNL